jgi:cyclic pyranopterin phosphate synthase
LKPERRSLSHVDEAGAIHMVDVGSKPAVRRRAVAHASLRMKTETAAALRSLPKGDALAAAQIAGIMAAKRTAELIPLCHPLTATVETTAPTGVEMEALTAVSVAALTLYDMAKAVDTEMVVSEIRLLEKTKERAR